MSAMPTTNLQALATEAREINAANGWGTAFSPDTNSQEIPGYLALIHSEITEAWTAARPEDAARELGDVIIRALDLGELIRAGVWQDCAVEMAFPSKDLRETTWNTDLLYLHTLTSQALEIYRKQDVYEGHVLRYLHLIVSHTWVAIERHLPGTDPAAILREILEANRKRAYRHGGRRT